MKASKKLDSYCDIFSNFYRHLGSQSKNSDVLLMDKVTIKTTLIFHKTTTLIHTRVNAKLYKLSSKAL